MNSSLKQPYPVSLSLNDCLIKGPSALLDLFMVTLCIRELRYALTKDLSKFYQRVDADPIAQNLRRVMWRGGDTSTEMKVYITTTVNFGDKPAIIMLSSRRDDVHSALSLSANSWTAVQSHLASCLEAATS